MAIAKDDDVPATNPADAYRIDKREVRRAFNAAAGSYERNAVLQARVEDNCLERLNLIKRNPQRVLDLGCGPGRGSRALTKRYARARVTSLDIAPAMVHRARARKRWFARQSFVCGDADRLPCADGSFDLVFSNLTLQWCTDLDTALAEVRRVLAADGLFLFSMFGPDTLMELRRAWRIVDDREHVSAFIDMHDLGDALVRAGFEHPVMDTDHYTLTYDSVAVLARDLKSIGAHNALTGRPRGLTGRARWNRLIDAYETFREADRLPATYEVCFGHGWSPERPQTDAGEAPISWAPPRAPRRHD